MTQTLKRQYNRRSDDQRIAELQSKIDELQNKIERKKRTDQPVLTDIPKVQRRLRQFAQLAANYGRDDLANSTMAFMAGLDRMCEAGEPRRRES